MNYVKPNVSIDVVVFTMYQDKLYFAFQKRATEPFLGKSAFVGGYVHTQEDKNVYDSALRIMAEKGGLKPRYMEQLETVAGLDRDPRGWSVSVVYVALQEYHKLDTKKGWEFCLVDEIEGQDMAFDHKMIAKKAALRLKNKAMYSILPAFLLGEKFTIPELQKAYEVVRDERLNKGSFKRILDKLDFLELTGQQVCESGKMGRHAQQYQVKNAYLNDLLTFNYKLS